MKTFEVIAGVCACTAIGLSVYGLTYDRPVPELSEKSNLVCFDMTRNLRLNLVEHNIRFDHNIIRFSNKQGEYAIYPPYGWLCSIVKARKQ